MSSVVHCAWAVNFNLQLGSFVGDCIAGVAHLLDLCLAARAPQPASFNFCSSISTVFNTAREAPGVEAVTVREALPPSLACAQGMGYAQSKLVAEHVCARAAAAARGMRARVLRVGQIVGDERHGVWSATEAVPLMLRSAVTLGALPALDEWVRWLPVDVVARACGEVGVGGEAPAEVYNVVNPQAVHWTREVLPMLRAAGLAFEEVGVGEWLERLRRAEQDPEKNPPVKLVTFWEGKYGKVAQAEEKKPEVRWQTEKVRTWSQAMATVDKPGKELLQKIVGYFLNEAWKVA